MSNTSFSQDGLLLLLQAAEQIDREALKNYIPSDKWEVLSGSSKNNYDGEVENSPIHPCSIHRRGVSTTRCSHNELEKSRRAHLRTCMESLKERLVFDSDVPRITMLTVLRKATATIHLLRQKNEYIIACEDREKQRCTQLLKRRQNLRKKLDARQSRNLKIESWRERNRNYSECSALTTSSEDSEVDFVNRFQSSNNSRKYNSVSRTMNGIGDQCSNFGTTGYTLPSYRKLTESPATVMSPSFGADAYDASSSDSGFEEVTVTCGDDTSVSLPSKIMEKKCSNSFILPSFNVC